MINRLLFFLIFVCRFLINRLRFQLLSCRLAINWLLFLLPLTICGNRIHWLNGFNWLHRFNTPLFGHRLGETWVFLRRVINGLLNYRHSFHGRNHLVWSNWSQAWHFEYGLVCCHWHHFLHGNFFDRFDRRADARIGNLLRTNFIACKHRWCSDLLRKLHCRLFGTWQASSTRINNIIVRVIVVIHDHSVVDHCVGVARRNVNRRQSAAVIITVPTRAIANKSRVIIAKIDGPIESARTPEIIEIIPHRVVGIAVVKQRGATTVVAGIKPVVIAHGVVAIIRRKKVKKVEQIAAPIVQATKGID